MGPGRQRGSCTFISRKWVRQYYTLNLIFITLKITPFSMNELVQRPNDVPTRTLCVGTGSNRPTIRQREDREKICGLTYPHIGLK